MDELHKYQEPMIRRSLVSCQRAANRRRNRDWCLEVAGVVIAMAVIAMVVHACGKGM